MSARIHSLPGRSHGATLDRRDVMCPQCLKSRRRSMKVTVCPFCKAPVVNPGKQPKEKS